MKVQNKDIYTFFIYKYPIYMYVLEVYPTGLTFFEKMAYNEYKI